LTPNPLKKPICIAFAGMVGTSKTPIATFLSWNLALPIFSNDAIRSEIHEDTRSKILDQELFVRTRDDRLKKIVNNRTDFILDASVDRKWKNVKQLLSDSDYKWFVISVDLTKQFVRELYQYKEYANTMSQIDKLYTEHDEFLKSYSNDVTLTINNNNFSNRMEICLSEVKKFINSMRP